MNIAAIASGSITKGSSDETPYRIGFGPEQSSDVLY